MANSNTTQHNGWGGSWTEQKLDCFESYVKAYLTIMNVYRDKFKWCIDIFDRSVFAPDDKYGWELLEKILKEDGLTKRSNLSEQELNNYINILKLKGEI